MITTKIKVIMITMKSKETFRFLNRREGKAVILNKLMCLYKSLKRLINNVSFSTMKIIKVVMRKTSKVLQEKLVLKSLKILKQPTISLLMSDLILNAQIKIL